MKFCVRDSEKTFYKRSTACIRQIGSRPRAFQQAISLDGVRIPKTPSGWPRKRFLCFVNKCNSNQIKSATKFLRVKTSSGKVVDRPISISLGLFNGFIDIGAKRTLQLKI